VEEAGMLEWFMDEKVVFGQRGVFVLMLRRF
jgi:hypothetical protein